MNQTNKGKAKIFSAWLCTTMILILTICHNSIGFNYTNFHNPLTTDTIPAKKLPVAPAVLPNNDIAVKPLVKKNTTDTIPAVSDSIKKITVDTFNYKTSSGALDVPVAYHADDSMVMDIPKNTIRFYGKKSTVKYAEKTAMNNANEAGKDKK